MPFLPLFLALATAPASPQALYEHLSARTFAAYDSARGGFASRDGVPSEAAIELALLRGRETGDAAWTARGLVSLESTCALMDTVGGGFHHSRRDADPGSASFEKRTDSNARRLELLVRAWQITGDSRWLRDAGRVVDYAERVLVEGRGGFVVGQFGDRNLVPEVNGLAIGAWCFWAVATTEPRQRDFVLLSLDRVWEMCWNADAGLLRRGDFDELMTYPQLSDQVEMGRACVLGSRLGGRPRDLERARTLGDLLLSRFEDREKGGFRTQAAPARDGGVKRAARVPDENARATRFLCELTELTGDAKYREAAVRAFAAFEKSFEKAGADAADWTLAVRASYRSDLPERPTWKSLAERSPSSRPRSVSFKSIRR